VVPKTIKYEASGGREEFISLVLRNNALAGYVRLRKPLGETALIRELKVFGRMARLGERDGEWQHMGLGGRLLAMAEASAAEDGYSYVKVTSGVGVRRYYASRGYERALPHMQKRLASDND
jgi:elongator complex protein 3